VFLETPLDDLQGWQRIFRMVCDVPVHALARMKRNLALQMSAALAYQTIFGMVPLIVIAMVLFRAFGGTSLLVGVDAIPATATAPAKAAEIGLIERLFNALGFSDIQLGAHGQTLSGTIIDMVRSIDQTVNFTSVSIIGVFVFTWAAINLLTTIERSFNLVCRAPTHRSFARRFPLYWMAMTVGPALLYASYWLQSRVTQYILEHLQVAFVKGLLTMAAHASSFAALWLFLIGLYTLMPNARVRLWAGAIGAFCATILWGLATRGLTWYVGTVFHEGTTMSILYGSLGLIPVFLLWINVIWLVVLFGLEMSVSLQSPARHRTGLLELRPQTENKASVLDPAFAVPVMAAIAGRFEDSLPSSASDVADAIKLPQMQVELLLEAFADQGLLHRLERVGGTMYSLTKPADRITIDQLLSAAQTLTGAPSVGPDAKGPWNWVQQLREAQYELARKTTLADLAY